MAAGDINFASRKAGSAKFFYAADIDQRKTTAKDYLLSSSGIKISKKTFNYNNFLPDLFAKSWYKFFKPPGTETSIALATKSGKKLL